MAFTAERLHDGHRLLKRVGDHYGIIDDDDAEFEMDFTRPLDASSHPPGIPIKDDDGEYHTPTDLNTLFYLAHRFNWTIEAGARSYTVARAE